MARTRTKLQPDYSAAARAVDQIVESVGHVIEGKDDVIRQALVCLLSGGHLLIEDVPGVGKTMLAKAIARSTSCTWSRIQFTPDLLPSDVLGVSIYDQTTKRFNFVPGAVFANLVLGDEINRATPKTQSALLESMEERQVTSDNVTRPLPDPFMVMATQNPLEHEGIFPLPQSQIDRFTMRIKVGYPSPRHEMEVLETHGAGAPLEEVVPVIKVEDVVRLIQMASTVHVAPAVKQYIIDICNATRSHPDLMLGASPRGALFLLRTARAKAASEGRDFVLPEDVKLLAQPVLAHRVILAPDAEMRQVGAHQVVQQVMDATPAPAGAASSNASRR